MSVIGCGFSSNGLGLLAALLTNNKMTSEYWALLNVSVSAIIGAATALITLYVQGKRKEGDRKRVDYDAYKKYAKPIILSAETLAWRLREVLRFQGAYLLPNAPMNGFFKYKFDSTVYRLCALIGWIRAAQKEHSYLEGFGDANNSDIREAINSFQRVLADGSHVEVSIFEELSRLYELEQIKVSDQVKLEIGVGIERIVFEYIPDQVKKNVSELEKDKKLGMVLSVMNLISKKTGQADLDRDSIEPKIDIAIDEIAREFCWIYRDWQSAIGDEMLVRMEGSYRYFDIIGFSEFSTKHEKSEWLKKVDNLFSNLNVAIDDRFDTRVSQVKQIYTTLIVLIEKLNKTISNEQAISPKGLKTLTEFGQSINKNSQPRIKG